MANTVIAIFDQAEQAQQAQDHLLTQGFTEQQVNIKTASYKAEPEDEPEENTHETGLMDNITAFFKDLFGTDDKEVANYAMAGKHRTIVTVHTDSGEEAQQVADILDSFGAIDVNETSGSYFPENEKSPTQHQFWEAPTHNAGETHSSEESEIQARVSGIKSRIIQRSVDKGEQ